MIQLINNDCLIALRGMGDNSVDSVVTDPPYGLSFMNKKWDYDVPCVDIWREVLRVLKPGGHLLSFGGTRTYHRMVVNIEDAGFEIRDQIQWIYGSGFPKSLDISKTIDKMNGAEREIIATIRKTHIGGSKERGNKGWQCPSHYDENGQVKRIMDITIPATEDAKQWEGWGTALKPANEPICLARKPLSEKTVASNVLKWGTGGLNIDGCRISTGDKLSGGMVAGSTSASEGWDRPWRHNKDAVLNKMENCKKQVEKSEQLGRFPANIIHDGSEEVLQGFPNVKSGSLNSNHFRAGIQGSCYGKYKPMQIDKDYGGDSGSAARFFYCAKASKSERNKGLETFDEIIKGSNFGNNGARPHTEPDYIYEGKTRNNHPTVKPVALMRYLCRMITPPKGKILDPFMGSGSTGIGAKLEGFSFVGIEREKEYCDIAKARIDAWQKEIIPKSIELDLFNNETRNT